MNSPLILSVSQLNRYVRSKLEEDPKLSSVFVSGEISNFVNHYKSGHMYLSLKDESAVIKAAMFARQAARLRFLPKDGMKVIVRGRVSVYEAGGQYQLYIDDMQPDGLGALNLAFEQLKEKLAAEGLFDAARKRPLPPCPQSIGIITSPTGAAVHDIVTVLGRRWPLARVVFCPVLVQGEGAAPQLADAVKRMNRLQCADVLILGRGGGSLEDLWAFNEESVARAVAGSRIPVISAVGHETDFTICDFVADLRAPTPSAAAELAVPDEAELRLVLDQTKRRLKRAAEARMAGLRQSLDQLGGLLRFPERETGRLRVELDGLSLRLAKAMDGKLEKGKTTLGVLSGRLHALSPLAVLSRGYAAVRCGGMLVSHAAQIDEGQRISVAFQDGELDCTVERVKL